MKPINQTLYDKVKMSLTLSEISEVMRIHRLSAPQVKMINKSVDYQGYCERVEEIKKQRDNEDRFAREIYQLPMGMADLMREVKAIQQELRAIREIVERLDLKN